MSIAETELDNETLIRILQDLITRLQAELDSGDTGNVDTATAKISDISKPLPSEHAARQNDPGKYKNIRRVNDEFGPGIDVQYGILADGKTEIQSIHFAVDKFSPEQARKWLVDHKYAVGRFEQATGKPKKE